MAAFDFETVDGAALQAVCDQGWTESATLDFKKALPTKDDAGRREFLKDVCAFANAEGGDLLYGIEERAGNASAPAPILGEAPDGAKLRLGQVLDSGLEPRLQGVRFRDVQFPSGGYALLVRVPASFNGPHRYSVGGAPRFVIRSGTHTSDLTYDQLRNAFDRTATLTERARSFRSERIAGILAGRASKQMRKGPLCVVHVLPIAAMGGRVSVDVARLYYEHGKFSFEDWGGSSRALNLDGIVAFASDGIECFAYTLVFRWGAIESVRFAGLTIDLTRKVIPSLTIATYVREAVGKLTKGCHQIGAGGPGFVGAALLNVEGYEFAIDNSTRASADRPHLILPELWVEDLGAVDDIDAIARPVLDTLWQACDYPTCPYYEGGLWKGK